jgi:heme-degrading monooxygenase HmoA
MSGHAIMIRVTPEDFEQWLEAHNSCQDFRSEYGMTDGPIYRDAADPNVALVHLDIEDVGRAVQWFKSPEFKNASRRAGKVQRDIWISELK